MSLDALPETRAVLERGRADGLHHGAQLFVSHRRKTVCDAAVGEVRLGEKLTPNHLMLWLSAGKPVTAAAVLKLCEPYPEPPTPRLSLDTRVAKVLPEFAAGHDDPRRRRVTVRHLLTHTAGLVNADPDYPEATWEESIARLCAAPLEADWQVGRTAGYSPKAAWFLLGEILRRADACEPDPPEPVEWEVASGPHAQLGGGGGVTWGQLYFEERDLPVVRPRLAPMYRRQGRELVDAAMDTDAHLTRVSPGSSLRGPASALGRFYEMLLMEDGAYPESELLTGLSIPAMTARHRVGEFDRTLGHVVDFGLGVIVDSNRYGPDTVPYGFGPHCSPRTFGHGGNQSSMAFCDPENGLVVAWATNGMCGEPKHQRRNRAINAAIYEDLGLVS